VVMDTNNDGIVPGSKVMLTYKLKLAHTWV